MKVNILFLLAMLAGGLLQAQNPVPAPPQSEKIAIQNATIHLGNGQVIQNGEIRLAQGRIERVGTPTRELLSDYRLIDASGKHIFPGLIAMNTTLGLLEIGAVRSTSDRREVGRFNPNVRSLIAFNVDSQVLPTVRSRGVMLVQTIPEGGVISGRSSVFQMDGWNYEDAVVAPDQGMHLRWPSRRSYNWRKGHWETDEDYPEKIRELNNVLGQAKAFCASDRDEKELKYAALCPVLDGDTKLYVHARSAVDILAALDLRQTHPDLQLVIVGGDEAYLVTEQLVAARVPVVVGSTQALPRRNDDAIDQAYRLPAMLADAGVTIALSHGGRWGGWQQRNLPFQAGQAVAYGLDYEAAVEALTLEPARILGIDQDYGSLESGKSATLIVVDGDLFDSRSSRVERAFIDGREINLDNKQSYLNRKYREKYQR